MLSDAVSKSNVPNDFELTSAIYQCLLCAKSGYSYTHKKSGTKSGLNFVVIMKRLRFFNFTATGSGLIRFSHRFP